MVIKTGINRCTAPSRARKWFVFRCGGGGSQRFLFHFYHTIVYRAIQTILFFMETTGLTDADCKMGLAFGRSNRRADCMDDSGVHATRVEWPLRGSGKSLITFAVSFGIAAVEGGSLVASCLADVPSGIGPQTTAWRSQLSGLGPAEFLFCRGAFWAGGGVGTTGATKFCRKCHEVLAYGERRMYFSTAQLLS